MADRQPLADHRRRERLIAELLRRLDALEAVLTTKSDDLQDQIDELSATMVASVPTRDFSHDH